MADAARPTPQAVFVPARRTWSLPVLRELPKLTDLTLASAIGGGGGTSGGGSTVFGILLALGVLTGCMANDSMEPSEPPIARAIAEVPCEADVTAETVTCGGGPAGAPGGQVILGGQGIAVLLGTNLVQYNTNDSTFVIIMTVKNLSAQLIGWDGLTFNPTGIRIVFQQDPYPTSGTGAITYIYDSIGTFTAANQHYYVHPSIVAFPLGAPQQIPLIKFHIPPTVLTFKFTVLVAAAVPDASGPVTWQPVPGWSADAFSGVAASSATDVVAVGKSGSSRRWDGTEWRSLVPFTTANFNAVASLGGGEYVAVADGGEIWRLNGIIWTKVYTETHGYDLTRVWARNGGHFVAAGEAGATVTYAGGSFTEQLLPGAAVSDTALAVTGKGDGSGIAVLLQSNSLYKRTGSAPFVFVQAITGDAGGVVYDENDQLLWTFFDPGAYEGVIRLDAADILRTFGERPVAITTFPGQSAVVAYFNQYSNEGHVDQVNYASLPAGGPGITGIMTGHRVQEMALVGSTLYLATTGGALLRWNGGGVQNMQPLRGPDPEIWGIGDTAWIVTGDNDGRVGRFVNGVVTLLGAPDYGQAKHIAGISSTEVYITDNSYIYRSYGSAWGYEYGTSFGNISALWGDTATGNIIFVVDNGDITTRTWGSWADHYHAGPAGATEVWGCSATNAWIAVGNQLWRWDGTTATQDGNYASNVFNGTIRSLTGTSCNDIWATADNGFAHYNGSTWTGSYGIPMGVAVPRAAELAWLLNGTTFNRLVGPSGDGWEMRTPTQNRPITAAWRAASGGLLVAGNGFLLWGDK